jgi:hypothetical protein
MARNCGMNCSTAKCSTRCSKRASWSNAGKAPLMIQESLFKQMRPPLLYNTQRPHRARGTVHPRFRDDPVQTVQLFS